MLKNVNSFSVLLLDLIEIAFIGVAVFVLVFVFVGQPLEITGDSMTPTLENKEQIIAEKLSTRFKEVKRGDIVVFKHPDRPDILIIKRVVGLPGEQFEITDGRVFINNKAIEEPYLKNEKTLGGQKIHNNVDIIIKDNHYVLLGDNRSNSTDSRKWGTINGESIIGKGFLVFYPIEKIRVIGTKVSVEGTAQKIRDLVNDGKKLAI